MPVRLPIVGQAPTPPRPEPPKRPPVVLSAARLFDTCFRSLYPPDALADLAKARATDANPAKNPSVLASIEQIADVFARLAPSALDAPDLVLDRSDASVHRLGARVTRARRDAWLAPSGPGEPAFLATFATHGALYVGACVVKNHGGEWLVRRPLWESQVRLVSRAGTAELAIFHWWLKTLGDEEIDAPLLGARYRSHVEVPTMRPEDLPVIAQPSRRIPRLAKVRYHTLHQHLRAHLPELRDVGEDFPSPERFEELGFRWLDFALLGEGRLVLVHGPSSQGVHLFWLDAGGFVKSAFYPADAVPEHKVELDGDVLRVLVSIEGRLRVHETLWWGA
jgi:hypothetical protein